MESGSCLKRNTSQHFSMISKSGFSIKLSTKVDIPCNKETKSNLTGTTTLPQGGPVKNSNEDFSCHISTRQDVDSTFSELTLEYGPKC